MPIVVYDAVTPAHLPLGAPGYLAYIDGKYANYSEVRARVGEGPVVKTVAVRPSDPADILDVEKGDAQPSDVPAWVEWMQRLGRRPTVYCSESSWQPCKTALAAAGVPEPDWYIADTSHGPTIPQGAVGVQWQQNVPPGYDISFVQPWWIGEPPATTITPTSTSYPEDHMIKLTGAVTIADGGGNITPAQLPGLILANVISVVPYADEAPAPISFAGVDDAGGCLRFIGENGGPYGFEVWQVTS